MQGSGGNHMREGVQDWRDSGICKIPSQVLALGTGQVVCVLGVGGQVAALSRVRSARRDVKLAF